MNNPNLLKSVLFLKKIQNDFDFINIKFPEHKIFDFMNNFCKNCGNVFFKKEFS